MSQGSWGLVHHLEGFLLREAAPSLTFYTLPVAKLKGGMHLLRKQLAELRCFENLFRAHQDLGSHFKHRRAQSTTPGFPYTSIRCQEQNYVGVALPSPEVPTARQRPFLLDGDQCQISPRKKNTHKIIRNFFFSVKAGGTAGKSPSGKPVTRLLSVTPGA